MRPAGALLLLLLCCLAALLLPVQAGPMFQLFKSAKPLGLGKYEVTVSYRYNDPNDKAGNIYLEDPVPEELELVSGTPTRHAWCAHMEGDFFHENTYVLRVTPSSPVNVTHPVTKIALPPALLKYEVATSGGVQPRVQQTKVVYLDIELPAFPIHTSQLFSTFIVGLFTLVLPLAAAIILIQFAGRAGSSTTPSIKK